jgi:hypothetical protein
MEVFDNPVVRTLLVLASATLASAFVQFVLGKKPNWLRAFALAFGLVSGMAAAEYFGLSGALQFILLAAWIALLVAAADFLPLGKTKSDA